MVIWLQLLQVKPSCSTGLGLVRPESSGRTLSRAASDLVDQEGLRRRPSPVFLVLVSDADQDVVSASCHRLPGRVSTHQGEMSPLTFPALLKTCDQSSEVRAHNTTHASAELQVELLPTTVEIDSQLQSVKS